MKCWLKRASAIAMAGGGVLLASFAIAGNSKLTAVGHGDAGSAALSVQSTAVSSGKVPSTTQASPIVPAAIAPYCVNTYTSAIEPITLVKISDINNTSAAATGGTAHEDFTSIVGTLRPGATYAVTMKANTDGASFQHGFALYADWNLDGLLTGANEGYWVGQVTGSTGTDALFATAYITVPAGATLGNTRLRAMTAYNTTALTGLLPCRVGAGYGQSEDYTVLVDANAALPPAIPSLSKAFSPTNADVSLPTTLTLSLTQLNAGATPLTLTADLVDTFPAGLTVAATPNSSTTCTSGTVTAVAAANSVTLATGAQIPPAGCTVTVSVQAAAAGIYTNTIAANSLQTDGGNVGGVATATYQATSPGVATYSTGFETPTFVVANLGTQGGWGVSGTAADWKIATTNAAAGTQELRANWATAGTAGATTVAISPTFAAGTTAYSVARAKLAIQPNATGAAFDFAPQDTGAGSVITRVRFNNDAAKNIQILDSATVTYINTGATWTAGSTYFDLRVVTKRADSTYQVCINGTSIFAATGFAPNLRNVAFIGNKGPGTNGNIFDIDDVSIDNTNIGTCNGLPPPHDVTPSVGAGTGTITPNTVQSVADGATAAFVLAAGAGFHVDTTTGTCGGTYDSGTSTFTTAAVTADCSVIANFAADVVTHTVTPSVGTGTGTITPSSPQIVNDGATQAFTLAPAVGFSIDTTTGSCPGSLAGSVYTAGPITADCTVIANFAPSAAPSLSKSFTPATVLTDVNSIATITLTNPTALPAVLTAPLTDALPAGLTVVSATTSCGIIVSRPQNPSATVGLPAGVAIPANGSCTLDIVVKASVAGSYVNTLAAGALQTDQGNNAVAASATLTVTGPVVSTFPPDENFDEVTAPALPVGWVSTQTGAGIAWITDSTNSDTAPNSAYAPNLPAVADMMLTSPTFTPVAGQTVSFKHRYNLEHGSGTTAFDGAVLEISINGGAFTDIVAAGGIFTAGGYNSTVSASFSSPLASRACWGGNSATFSAVVANLPAAAVGQPTQLRFRTADDSSASATAPSGWWVDTIHLDVAVVGPPSATVTPGSLSFTVQADQTQDHTLNIANAINSSPLTFAIAGQASRHINFAPHGKTANREYASRDFGKVPTPRAPLSVHSNQFASGQHSRPAPWAPIGPDGSTLFQADDGTYENAVAFSDGTTQNATIWINRYPVTEAMTIDSISIDWPNATTADGDVTGKSINLVVYYDADADGDPTNAVRLGTDTLVTITGPDAFENYTTNFSVPGAGDVYIGFVDAFATGGSTPVLYSAALDTAGVPTIGWVSGSSTGDADINSLANNDTTDTIGNLAPTLAGVWMIRATGTGAGGAPCTGAAVNWLTATPANGTVNGGSNTNVTITANPSADSLAPGSYTGELCITTNDPAHLLIARPVTLTVTAIPFVPCAGGVDELFCDGFEGSGGGANVVTGTINQPVTANGDGSSFDFALGSFHPYDANVTADDINLYTLAAPAISVYWYGDAVPDAFTDLVGGVVTTPGGTDFTSLHSGDSIGPSSPVSAASAGADMSAFEVGGTSYIGVAFYNEATAALNFGYLHVTTAAGGFPIQVLDYGYDNSGAAITIP